MHVTAINETQARRERVAPRVEKSHVVNSSPRLLHFDIQIIIRWLFFIFHFFFPFVIYFILFLFIFIFPLRPPLPLSLYYEFSPLCPG